jgi:hypothetical protein
MSECYCVEELVRISKLLLIYVRQGQIAYRVQTIYQIQQYGTVNL